MTEQFENQNASLEVEITEDALATADAVMAARDLERVRRTQKIMKIASTTLIYIFLVIIAVVIIFPFYWMLISSVKSLEEYRCTLGTFPKRPLPCRRC